jgi:hypothetical protein
MNGSLQSPNFKHMKSKKLSQLMAKMQARPGPGDAGQELVNLTDIVSAQLNGGLPPNVTCTNTACSNSNWSCVNNGCFRTTDTGCTNSSCGGGGTNMQCPPG